VLDFLHDIVDLLVGEFWKHWEGDQFLRTLFGHRKISLFKLHKPVGRLKVDRDWVMDSTIDVFGL
jgi:hypothetical protein